MRDIRINRLERTVFPMNIIQVPAKPSHWGLTTWPYGVSGRLGQKVNKIIIHWADGTLASTDKVFTGQTNPERMASAHFCVEDEIIHQYVSVNNVAWHANNWSVNLTSVGIEHSAQPGREATDATYSTSGALIAQLWSQFDMIPSRDTLIPHSKVSMTATACPGTMNLDRLYTEALAAFNHPTIQLANSQITSQQSQVHSDISNTTTPITGDFTIVVNAPLGMANFRSSPSMNSTIKASYPNGTEVVCTEELEKDYITIKGSDGKSISSNIWYKSKGHGWYISSTVSRKQ